MNDFTVVIPTFHEAMNIPELLARFKRTDFGSRNFEVIIVDDDSRDGIVEICAELSAEYPWLKLIVRNAKRSLSEAVINGFNQARYSLLVSMDADLSHPPEIIPEMLAIITELDTDFVIGSRYIEGGSSDISWPIFRKATSNVAAFMAKMLLSTPVKDPLSGFFALKKTTFVSAMPLEPLGWKIGLELMIKCRCKHIREIPIHFSHRKRGSSKINYKIALEYLRHLFRLLRYKLFYRQH